jgi:hypothetical protein
MANNSCKDCHNNCLTCTGLTKTDCNSCKAPQIIEGSFCEDILLTEIICELGIINKNGIFFSYKLIFLLFFPKKKRWNLNTNRK